MENVQQPREPEDDPAAAAFARLESEVGVVRRLVAANDNSATLGEIVSRLDKMVEAIKVLARLPALQFTPDEMAVRITAAGEKARAQDSATIGQARDRIDAASRQMERLVGMAATIREQRRLLLWATGGGALAGVLLWSFLPGTIARTMPAGWHWPERMAAHVLHLDRWDAGERLLVTADPERWHAVLLGNRIVQDNREAIVACLRTAAEDGKPARCPVRVTAER